MGREAIFGYNPRDVFFAWTFTLISFGLALVQSASAAVSLYSTADPVSGEWTSARQACVSGTGGAMSLPSVGAVTDKLAPVAWNELLDKVWSEDRSCRCVITGNQGEPTADNPNCAETGMKAALAAKLPKPNASRNYFRVVARAFLNRACNLEKEPDHPMIRKIGELGAKWDALRGPSWVAIAPHSPIAKGRQKAFWREENEGIPVLAKSFALLYTMGLTESSGDPSHVDGNENEILSPKARATLSTGVLQQSVDLFLTPSEVTEEDETPNLTPIAVFSPSVRKEGKKNVKVHVPVRNYGQDLIRSYVIALNKVDEMADGPPKKLAFENLCGAGSLQSKYADRYGESFDAQTRLLRTLFRKSPSDCKKLHSRENYAGTRIESSGDALLYAEAWNKVLYGACDGGEAVRDMMKFCPQFAFDTGALAVRVQRQMHHDLRPDKVTKELVPSCQGLFTSIMDHQEQFCVSSELGVPHFESEPTSVGAPESI